MSSECSSIHHNYEWWFFIFMQIITFMCLIAVSLYCLREYRNSPSYISFYLFAILVCVFEASSLATQYENVLLSSSLHDFGAFTYILCFTLVLKHWIVVQLPLNRSSVRRRIFLGVIVVPNTFSFVSRAVLFFMKLSERSEEKVSDCKAKKIEAVLLGIINILLIVVVIQIAYRAKRLLPHYYLQALYEVVGYLSICVLCNVSRCVIAFLNSFNSFESKSICCTGQLIIYNSWLEELVPLMVLIKLMLSVSDKQLILPIIRRSVSNMTTRLLDGREDLMDLLQSSEKGTPPSEELIPWTTPPSSPTRMMMTKTTKRRLVSTHACSAHFMDKSFCVSACIRIRVRIRNDKNSDMVIKKRTRKYAVVVTCWNTESRTTEYMKFDQNELCFTVVLRIPLIIQSEDMKLDFKLCYFDTNSIINSKNNLKDDKSVLGTCSFMWSSLVESICCEKYLDSSTMEDICIDLLAVSALPRDVTKMLSPMSASSMLSTMKEEEGDEDEEKENEETSSKEKRQEESTKQIVRMFQFPTTKSKSPLLVTETLQEVPYALSITRILLENLVLDLKESLHNCRRELAMSGISDREDVEMKIPSHESSMQMLLVELHNEAIGKN